MRFWFSHRTVPYRPVPSGVHCTLQDVTRALRHEEQRIAPGLDRPLLPLPLVAVREHARAVALALEVFARLERRDDVRRAGEARQLDLLPGVGVRVVGAGHVGAVALYGSAYVLPRVCPQHNLHAHRNDGVLAAAAAARYLGRPLPPRALEQYLTRMQWSSLKPIPAAMDRQYSGSYHCDMDDAHQDDSHFSDMGDAGEEPSSLLNTAYGRFNERSNTSLAFAAPVLVNTGQHWLSWLFS